jgi:enterobacterial common antigen flippase
MLGGSSLVSIVAGVLSTKVMASSLEPQGFGLLGLNQSLFSLSTMIAGMGISVALVREGAAALATEDLARLASLRLAASRLIWWFAGISVCILALARAPLSAWMLGSRTHEWNVVIVGLSTFLGLHSGLNLGTLNTYHKIKALAFSAIVYSLISAAVGILLIWFWREAAIPWVVLASASINFMVSSLIVRREIKPTRFNATPFKPATQSLLAFGIPYTASMVVGAGILQFLIPVVVLHQLSAEAVGYFRAASAISVGYLFFLLNAMAQDYFPRVSAVQHDPEALRTLVNRQHQLVMIVGVPVILIALGLTPILVPLAYSNAFQPAVQILEWQLVGDVFKFSSWTMSFVILARGGNVPFFLAELTAGIASLGFSLLGMRFFGLTGLGVAYLATYILYWITTWVIVRRQINLVWTHWNRSALILAIVATSLVGILSTLHFQTFATSTALFFAICALILVWRQIKQAGLLFSEPQSPFNQRWRPAEQSPNSAGGQTDQHRQE